MCEKSFVYIYRISIYRNKIILFMFNIYRISNEVAKVDFKQLCLVEIIGYFKKSCSLKKLNQICFSLQTLLCGLVGNGFSFC